jgi:hypothetical protein
MDRIAAPLINKNNIKLYCFYERSKITLFTDGFSNCRLAPDRLQSQGLKGSTTHLYNQNGFHRNLVRQQYTLQQGDLKRAITSYHHHNLGGSASFKRH